MSPIQKYLFYFFIYIRQFFTIQIQFVCAKILIYIFSFIFFRRSEFIGCLSVSVKTALENCIAGSFKLQPQSCLAKPIPLILEVEEKIVKNEETFHQSQEGKDDNSLLQYLELSDVKNFLNANGRTPFTLTKHIEKQRDESFGFEISWTKPPRINSVKSPNCGLLKGDFIIFVEEVNIVTKPKEEIISLIKNQESFLTLEIFRPTEKISSKEIIDKLASQNTPVASNLFDSSTRKTNEITDTPKSRKSFLFKPPKICFQPTVGSGVIV